MCDRHVSVPMSVTGLCQICEAAEARFVCERCGSLVCTEHYDEELGYCATCAAEVRAGRGDGEGRDDGRGRERDEFDDTGGWGEPR